jgi:hypothetical protein
LALKAEAVTLQVEALALKAKFEKEDQTHEAKDKSALGQ